MSNCPPQSVSSADPGWTVTPSRAGQNPAAVEHSVQPYQLKRDPYSSHSVILALLGEGRGRKLLDIGAAQGDMAQLLTERGFEVTALEGDPTLAAMAQGKCHKVVVANLDGDLPLLNEAVDVILYADVLEHLKDPLRVLRSINRQLKPGGLTVISVPNVAHLYVRLNVLVGRFEYENRGIMDRTHMRFFTLASFRQLLRDADLEILRLTATPVPLPLVVPVRYHGLLLNTIHGLSAMVARVWKTMFAYQFIAIARKGVAA